MSNTHQDLLEASRRISRLMQDNHLKTTMTPISNRYSILIAESTGEPIGLAHTEGIRHAITDIILVGDFVSANHNGRHVRGTVTAIIPGAYSCDIRVMGLDTDDPRDISFITRPNNVLVQTCHYSYRYNSIDITTSAH